MNELYFLAGLGNPGEQYKNTRHNFGRLIVDRFIENCPEQLAYRISVIDINTYMNLSGGAVAKRLGKDKKARIKNSERLIVTHDDLNIPFGEIRISVNKGDGGHNGVKDIIKALGTKNFIRVRAGIAPQYIKDNQTHVRRNDMARFVLQEFHHSEMLALPKMLSAGSQIIEDIIKHGIQFAMNKWNNRKIDCVNPITKP